MYGKNILFRPEDKFWSFTCCWVDLKERFSEKDVR